MKQNSDLKKEKFAFLREIAVYSDTTQVYKWAPANLMLGG